MPQNISIIKYIVIFELKDFNIISFKINIKRNNIYSNIYNESKSACSQSISMQTYGK